MSQLACTAERVAQPRALDLRTVAELNGLVLNAVDRAELQRRRDAGDARAQQILDAMTPSVVPPWLARRERDTAIAGAAAWLRDVLPSASVHARASILTEAAKVVRRHAGTTLPDHLVLPPHGVFAALPASDRAALQQRVIAILDWTERSRGLGIRSITTVIEFAEID